MLTRNIGDRLLIKSAVVLSLGDLKVVAHLQESLVSTVDMGHRLWKYLRYFCRNGWLIVPRPYLLLSLHSVRFQSKKAALKFLAPC